MYGLLRRYLGERWARWLTACWYAGLATAIFILAGRVGAGTFLYLNL